MTAPETPQTVAIAGSRALPPGQAPRLLLRFLAALPAGSTILLRRGLFSQPNAFEVQVEMVADLIGLDVEWCQPEPVPAKSKVDPHVVTQELGRRAVWARDVAMIDRADLVMTFVLAGQELDEGSGTRNLMEKALEHDKVVYSYSIFPYLGGDGSGYGVERIGENDPDDLWAELVPA